VAVQTFGPHGGEATEWSLPGGGPFASRTYEASIPPLLGAATFDLAPETLGECARAQLELAVSARSATVGSAHLAAIAWPSMRAESLASSLVDGVKTTALELAKSEAGLPSTRAGNRAGEGVEALAAHLTAAHRALGLGALAAANMAPGTSEGGRRVARYRTAQTWLGGSDLWPTGAAYVPPRPERLPALMDDLVEFCARTDVDPITQAAVAHAQYLSIQPFSDGNGRAARSLINGVWRRRGLTGHVVVPVSASIAGDARRYDAAWRSYGEGDADPMVAFVARHALRAVKEATASGDRVALLPAAWAEAARPRRGSATHALIGALAEHPIVTVADVRVLTGASQASAYDAIVRLAGAGVLRRLTLSRRDTVWIAGDMVDEVDRVTARLGRAAGGRASST